MSRVAAQVEDAVRDIRTAIDEGCQAAIEAEGLAQLEAVRKLCEELGWALAGMSSSHAQSVGLWAAAEELYGEMDVERSGGSAHVAGLARTGSARPHNARALAREGGKGA